MGYEEWLHNEGLCAEIVERRDEDGPYTDRCKGLIVSRNEPMCAGHLAEYQSWRGMTELEKAEWEYNQERW